MQIVCKESGNYFEARGTTRGTTRGPARGTTRGTARGTTRGPARGTTRGTARGTTRGPARGTTRGPARGTTRDTTYLPSLTSQVGESGSMNMAEHIVIPFKTRERKKLCVCGRERKRERDNRDGMISQRYYIEGNQKCHIEIKTDKHRKREKKCERERV